MPDWDENSPELNANLRLALQMARDGAKAREAPSLDMPRKWQSQIMKGLTPGKGADSSWYGKYRGEPGQEFIGVDIGICKGTPPHLVEKELQEFISFAEKAVAQFDKAIFRTDEHGIVSIKELNQSAVRAIVGLMAKVHGEWVRIHPFANGNGRTSRLWANWIAMRYGLPPFVGLRPRPRSGYEWASYMSMHGKWSKMRPVFEDMLDDMATDLHHNAP